MRRAALILGLVVVLGVTAPTAAGFCWDHTDKVVDRIQQVVLTTDQLQDVFQYQKQHRALITRSHEEGLGCAHHERAEGLFQKKAFGVLTDEQFVEVTGRERTELETLRAENYQLRKELAALRAELARLHAEATAATDSDS